MKIVFMKIAEVLGVLEEMAPPILQESYDNAGLLTGSKDWDCTGVLCTLDATEAVVQEAIQLGCNLIVAHHPIIFKGLKKINGKNYVEQAVIAAIKNDIAIYAIHTNLDNVLHGVNNEIAKKLQLEEPEVLLPKKDTLVKLFTFVPGEYANRVRDALFAAGAGNIGKYSECSFNVAGAGSFKAGEDSHPFVGEQDERHYEEEIKMEVILPAYKQKDVLQALQATHPYEEIAFDIIPLANTFKQVGSGIVGYLPGSPRSEKQFLEKLKSMFGLQVIRHSPFTGKEVVRVAICGGAGSFLTKAAIATEADVYVTADIKYHEFFDADGQILLADIGHWESEQFTIDLLFDILKAKFPTFAVLKTNVRTNPVHYFM